MKFRSLSILGTCAVTLALGLKFAAVSFAADDYPDLEQSLSEDLGEEDLESDTKPVTKDRSLSLDDTPAKDDEKVAESTAVDLDADASVDELLESESPTEQKAAKAEENWSDGSPEPLGSGRAGKKTQALVERGVAEEVNEPYKLSNLEFKVNKENGRSEIILTSPKRPKVQAMQGGNALQLVYLLEYAETPEKLQRAYDTSEFNTPVGLFTVFQIPGAMVPTSKIIVQLREETSPQLDISDRGLTLTFAPPSPGAKDVVFGDKRKEILSGTNIYSANQNFSGELIERLEIKNSDVQDVLRLIARTSGFNIVIGDDVSGSVGTLSLENIPWDQAFTLVLQSKKLSYVREGNVIRVGTTGALKAEKDEAYRIEEAARRVEPLKTLLLPVSYAKANTLAPRALSLLSERGKIDTDERTNTIIIKDIDAAVQKVQKLISALDTPPPRVQISARIMEVKNTFNRRLGFRTNSFNARFAGLDLEQTSAFSTNSGLSTTNISAANFGNLQAQFIMSEIKNEARTLANPTVVVVANQTATVTQKNTIFVAGATVTAVGSSPTFTQIPITLTLNVTPIVAGDGSIFMTLAINNDLRNSAGGNNFAVDTRTINTQILIENGGTAIIGGVFQNTITMSRNGIPILMDLPILGYLFSERGQDEDKNQILIFISARVLNAEESFKRSL